MMFIYPLCKEEQEMNEAEAKAVSDPTLYCAHRFLSHMTSVY